MSETAKCTCDYQQSNAVQLNPACPVHAQIAVCALCHGSGIYSTGEGTNSYCECEAGKIRAQPASPAPAAGGEWQKPLAEWRRIFRETPDYDCWPAPIRGWEVRALVGYIDALEVRLAAETARAEAAEQERDLVSYHLDHGEYKKRAEAAESELATTKAALAKLAERKLHLDAMDYVTDLQLRLAAAQRDNADMRNSYHTTFFRSPCGRIAERGIICPCGVDHTAAPTASEGGDK